MPKPFDATLSYILAGLRHSPEFVQSLFAGVRAMKESTSTYQAILEDGRVEGRAEGRVEGRVEEARHILLRLGRKNLGSPDAATLASIEAIQELERLEELTERLLEVASWQELFAPRSPARRNGKKRKSR